MVPLVTSRFIEVQGCSLYTVTMEPEQIAAYTPTIVIEAGCGVSSAMYRRIQQGLAKYTKVIAYDRAGLGKSEGNGKSKDACTIVDQFHCLLTALGVKGPVLLVGHSIAGLYLRVYAKKYPDNVVGLAFLDPSHPLQYAVLRPQGFPLSMRCYYYLMYLMAKLGVRKFFSTDYDFQLMSYNLLPVDAQREIQDELSLPQSYITPFKESAAFLQSAKQVLSAGDLGHLPLLVLTGPVGHERDDIWLILQRELLKISSRSKHHIIKGANHCSLVTDKGYADEVCQQIMTFVEEACKGL